MTAIVGVLNKTAVAIAADSAVTLGNTHKVINSGNKIFRLSKYASIGVATYGNATFLGTPWEVVIKQYRSQLKDAKYSNFNEYINNFLQFLRDKNFFSSIANQKLYLELQIKNFYEICVELSEKRPVFASDKHQAFIEELIDCKNANQASNSVIDDFINFDLADFKTFAQDTINQFVTKYPLFTNQLDIDTFVESYFYYLRIPLIRNNESGLVFFGYGEDEIYPSLQEVIITLGIDKKLQYRLGEKTVISNEGTAASVIPFAQTDVAQTVIRGVNPSFYKILSNSFEVSMNDFKSRIANVIRSHSGLDNLADRIESLPIDSITNSFITSSKGEFNKTYTSPLLQTIISLGITDMTNLAESFVSLTSLVRRMSPHEETVGGPVDVAVITKGDGFIWIKRKHYFDPTLNKHFFDNYYND